eukprot:Seg779.7 transcript_id=Seg779.7/GoldUCD/mRNA.D3Y31 product="hypothetical protein" protein_id=Seg779.7/GoldUCD/D3Y31
MSSKLFFVLCFAFASVCTVKCEEGFRYDSKCFSLCQEFVPFIQDVIGQKSSVAGAAPTAILYRMVNERATKFCLSKLENMDKCTALVEETWKVVIALQVGANVDEICKQLDTCKKNKTAEIIDTKDVRKTFKPFASACAEVFKKLPNRNNMCGGIPDAVKASVDSLGRIINGGDLSQELRKCPADGSGFGCYLNNSPMERQLAFVFMSSIMPSFSKIKAKVNGRFSSPDTWCKVKVDSEGKLISQWTKKEVVAVTSQCISTCKFVARSLFASFMADFTGKKDNKEKASMACAYMNITEADKCGSFSSLLSKFKTTFSATMADRFCSGSTCKMPNKTEVVNNCKKTVIHEAKFNGEANNFTGIKFKANKGETNQAITFIWFAALVVITLIILA